MHVHVSSNAVRRYSAVPYTLRAQGLTVCTPIRWDELGAFASAHPLRAADVPQRLQQHGDVFASELKVIAGQTFAAHAGAAAIPMRATPEPRGHIITATIDILNDGKPRDAKQLLQEALNRKLIPPNTTYHYVYTALIEYIARQLGRGRKPPILQDAQRRFRINEPPDDWPNLVPPADLPVDRDAQGLAHRLETTGSGDDPAAFERPSAIRSRISAFSPSISAAGPSPTASPMPFSARSAIVCCWNVRRRSISSPNPTPPKPRSSATLSTPISARSSAPTSPTRSSCLQELQTHRVTALTVPDLQTLLHVAANPLEIKRVLVSGYAGDVMSDLLWERAHGLAKRVATIAYLILREGWNAQRIAAEQGGAAMRRASPWMLRCFW